MGTSLMRCPLFDWGYMVGLRLEGAVKHLIANHVNKLAPSKPLLINY